MFFTFYFKKNILHLTLLRIIIISALASLMISCKKSEPLDGTPRTIQVFNGIENNTAIIGHYENSRPTNFSLSHRISSNGYTKYASEENIIRVNYFTVPDTLEKDLPAFSTTLNTESGKSYSLFLIGPKNKVEHLFIENKAPQFVLADSTTKFRIVNLSNENAVSINIEGMPHGSFIKNIAFKEASDFVELTIKRTNKEYTLEFRDVDSGVLLTTFLVTNYLDNIWEPNINLYRPWTLILAGKRDDLGNNALKTTRMNFW